MAVLQIKSIDDPDLWLRLDIPAVNDENGVFTFHGFGAKIEVACSFEGVCLRRFLDQLSEIYAKLDGTAWLVSDDHTVAIRFAAGDLGRGRFVVGGNVSLIGVLDYAESGAPKEPCLDMEYPGAEFNFDGIVTEQTYIPGYQAVLMELLKEAP